LKPAENPFDYKDYRFPGSPYIWMSLTIIGVLYMAAPSIASYKAEEPIRIDYFCLMGCALPFVVTTIFTIYQLIDG
jgi:hypothetical protein